MVSTLVAPLAHAAPSKEKHENNDRVGSDHDEISLKRYDHTRQPQSQANLQEQLSAMSFQQKAELHHMIEKYTRALISVIDDACARSRDDMCPRDDLDLEKDSPRQAGLAIGRSARQTGGVQMQSMVSDPSGTSSDAHVSISSNTNRNSTASESRSKWMSEDSATTMSSLNVGQMAKKFKLLGRSGSFEEELSREKKVQNQLLGHLDTAFNDTAIGILIMLNGVVMMIECEWKGWISGVKLGQVKEQELKWHNAQTVFDVLEHVFTLIFLLELIYKVSINKRTYFKEAMNLFDLFLVLVSVTDLYVLNMLFGQGSTSFDNLTVLRIMRMARLMRTFRMLRTLKLFSGLRVLVKSVGSCIVSLTWSMVLLTIFMMIGAIMMVSLLEEFVEAESNNYEHRLWAWLHYGTSFRATYTMFELTLSGCWPNYVRPLLKHVSWLYCIFFVIYVSVVVFAVIRIISAIFLKETMDAANSDADMVITDRARKKQHFLQKLEKVFQVADESGTGKIIEKEFDAAMEVPIVKSYMQALDLDVHEGQALFHMLDNGKGEVTREEFIAGVSRLKGQARSIDLIAIQMDAQRITKRLEALDTRPDLIAIKTDVQGNTKQLRALQDIVKQTVSPLRAELRSGGGLDGAELVDSAKTSTLSI